VSRCARTIELYLPRWLALLCLATVPGLAALSISRSALAEPKEAASADHAAGRLPERYLVRQYCLDCHNKAEKAGGLALDAILGEALTTHADVWEKVVRKLRARQMPPADATRPEEPTYQAALASLETALDQAAAEHPRPGRTSTFRRLNRTEYQNAIRDLLALEVDVAALLPADEASHGFDNVTVGDLSPTLLDRYLSAAEKISRLAIGRPHRSPAGDTFRMRPDVTQEEHVAGLPLGTRGGMLIPYNFPQDGEYDVQIRLARDRNEEVEGLYEPHELLVLLDREERQSFTVSPPKRKDHTKVDADLKARLTVAAGPHQLGVTFLQTSSSLLETRRQPYQAHFNMHRHPRQGPAVYQVSITGPYDAKGAGDTPSRRRIFFCYPNVPAEEEDCARQILAALLRRAYRRPVTDSDLARPLALFRQARDEEGFEAGIEMALSAVLISPQFLFRIEQDPPGAKAGSVYRVSDLDLASRLSFFLWSSIPDDELLDLAEAGRLSEPETLKQQVRRMLTDPRSQSLATNFGGQWLHMRNLDSLTPDLRLFPDFDDNLRQAMRRETELAFLDVLQNDQSVLKLIDSRSTWLNERLAKHYGIPHIYGERFRRVDLGENSVRGGLLRHGSVLTVTSYATRTSPVIRGKWVLENILGTPPPPPPANVPALKDNTVDSMLSVRARLAEHRANAACASCHNLMDPPGFALENFDAVGRWRTTEEGKSVDARGGLPDGSEFDGVAGLERAVLRRPEMFVGTLAEKLLTFALGRGVEPSDAPAIRQVIREAQQNDYRFSALIEGLVTSTPFLMRAAE
jgi:hypothetical protein